MFSPFPSGSYVLGATSVWYEKHSVGMYNLVIIENQCRKVAIYLVHLRVGT